VNLALDEVERRLGGRVRLADAARAAGLSPFHFHRVFQAIMGQTPADWVGRRRMDRAITIMADEPGAPMARVAARCGFASASDFSRAFKRHMGVPPSRFDIEGWRSAHASRLAGETGMLRDAPGLRPARLPPRTNPDGFRVRMRDLPARTVAYIRVRDPYRPEAVPRAAQRLVEWATRRRLEGGQWLGYQWERPDITPLPRCVYHVAVVADGFSPIGDVGRYRFPPMTVAQIDLSGPIDLELRALFWLYGVWLPRSGYVPDDQPAFEAWQGLPFAHGLARFDLSIQLPIRRAD